MRFHRSVRMALFAAAVALALPAPAALFRAYLSSTGNDANPCTLAAPCRLLPAALAAVADGGEVWILDSGNFNTAPVYVNKSLSVIAVPGAVASFVTTGAYGAIEATPTTGVHVSLRNIVFNAMPGATGFGIVANQVFLRLDGCTFRGIDSGILMFGGTRAVVTDTSFTNVPGDAIRVDQGTLTVVRGRFVNGGHAIYALGPDSTAFVEDSLFAYVVYGIRLDSRGPAEPGPAKAFVSRSQFYGTSYVGLYARGDSSAVTSTHLELNANLIVGNPFGIDTSAAIVQSATNNRLAGNTNDVTGGPVTGTPSN